MPNPTPPFVLPANAAALSLALGGENYPEGCNAHIFPDGAFRSDDGRPASQTNGVLLDWLMNAEIADALIAGMAERGKPILYDYEHNSLWGDSRAAGWIDRLVYAPGRGLYAHVEWTPDGAEAIQKKEYRYSSPLFIFDPKTGAVLTLLSVALTNDPALDQLGAVGLKRLAALANYAAGGIPGNHDGDVNMGTPDVAALTAERDGLKATVAALTTERDELKTKLGALEQEKADTALASEKAKHAELLTAALTDGRLTPAQKAWAEKQSMADLAEYLEATNPLAVLKKQADGKDGGNGLTPDELAICSKMGVTPEQFAAAKKNTGA
ncbi:MAG: hypothetical protein RIR00_1651 [Pseudomonadota bacterium]